MLTSPNPNEKYFPTPFGIRTETVPSLEVHFPLGLSYIINLLTIPKYGKYLVKKLFSNTKYIQS